MLIYELDSIYQSLVVITEYHHNENKERKMIYLITVELKEGPSSEGPSNKQFDDIA